MNYGALITAISDTHQQAQAGAAGAVNRHLILRNWLIGAHLVEYEQNGEDRAKYGTGLLRRVSADLRQRPIPGTSPDMLERMRLLYLDYPQLAGRISAPLVRKLPEARLVQPPPAISAPAVRKSGSPTPTPLPADELLALSWTHLADLVRLEDPWKRAFYENECLKGHWSKRQLQRQIGSLLYERTGLSTDKQAVNYWKTEIMAEGDNPPVGLLLCTDKDETKVEYATGGLDHQLFVSRYLVALPKPEQIQHLIETNRAVWEQHHPDGRQP